MLCLFIAAAFLIADNRRLALVQVAAQAFFRSAATLGGGDVPGAIANLAAAVHADPRNASTADRLYTLLVQRPTPWLVMERHATTSDIISSAVTQDARVFANRWNQPQPGEYRPTLLPFDCLVKDPC
jgi:hypothetical protein